MKQLTIFFFLLFVSLTARASFTFNENCKQSYTDMMCLRFVKAGTQMKLEKKLNPDNQVPYIIENYID